MANPPQDGKKPRARKRRPSIQTVKIETLKPDAKNARLHTDRNVEMIGDSIDESGTGRSVLIDETASLIAGNATIRAAIARGVKEVVIVDSDGDKIIAVRRRGLTDEQKQRLAIADNRAAELAEWDPDAVTVLPPGVTEGFWEADELAMLTPPELEEVESQIHSGLDSAEDDKGPPFLKVLVSLTDIATVERALRATGVNNRGEALLMICENYLQGQVSVSVE